jgi:hypothetical protein
MSAVLPSLSEYQAALQHPDTAFVDPALRRGSIVTDPLGMPKVVSGGFALTYQVQTASGRFAVRCFHRASPDLEGRYRAIQPVVAQLSRVFVPVEYQDEGVRVFGRSHPITKMRWIDGRQLGSYLESQPPPSAIQRIESALHDVLHELERSGVAHGDIQHGNVMIDRQGAVRLIDYDGMYVPGLAGRTAAEAGHVNYQHPLRTDQFDGTLDRFAIIVLTVALRALRADPCLWERYSDGDNVLFRRKDFVDPAASPLFAELSTLPQVAPLATRLAQIAMGPFVAVPRLEQFLSGEFALVARPATATRPALTTQYRVVDGADRETLHDLEGSVVTVVGRVIDVYSGTTVSEEPYAFLNFGDWRLGSFQLVLWSEALGNDLARARLLKGAWVTYTGLVSVYRGRTPSRPQVVLDSVPAVKVLDPDTAKQMLAAGREAGALPSRPAVAPSRRAPEPSAPTASGPAMRILDLDRWGQVIGSQPSGPAPTSSRRAPGPPQPTASAPAARGLAGSSVGGQVPGVNTPRARRPQQPAAWPLPSSSGAHVPSPPQGTSQMPSARTSPVSPPPPTKSSAISMRWIVVGIALLCVLAWFLVQQ